MKTFRAKYDGRCAGCGGNINVGDMIAWGKKDGKGISFHISCQPGSNGNEAAPVELDNENAAYEDWQAYREFYKDETGWLKG